jgi:hypothetical protein
MNNSPQPHVFWGKASPLAALSCGGLLVMASSRLAYALVTGFCLLWVNGLSIAVYKAAENFFPRKGKLLCEIFLASFLGSLFLLLLWLLSPLAALELFFVVSLIPFFCIASGIFVRAESLEMTEAVTRALAEAAVTGFLAVILSIIREPLGFFSLSLPGGQQGIIRLSFEGGSFLPIRIIASSAGALLLLGYGVGLYHYMRNKEAPKKKEK